jgi:Tfp pilus assembly protein PilV
MHKTRGFTLLEILISFFILAMILFCFEAMQIYALRKTRNAFYLTIAIAQMNTMLERLSVLNADTQGLAAEITTWNEQNRQVLPQGNGKVLGSFPHYQVQIYWGEKGAPCQQLRLGKSNCITYP